MPGNGITDLPLFGVDTGVIYFEGLTGKAGGQAQDAQ